MDSRGEITATIAEKAENMTVQAQQFFRKVSVPVVKIQEENEENIQEETYATINDAEEYQEAPTETDRSRMMMILFGFMLVIGTLNRIFSKLLTIPLKNYPIDVNITLSFIYCLFYATYVIPTIYCGDSITPSQREVNISKFALMGCLDSICSLMQTFSFNFISSGALIILLMQAAIPISMIITKIWIQTSYKFSQYFGALVVLGGLVIALLPKFIDPPSTSSSSTSNEIQIVWCVVLIASCIPMTISAVLKEKTLLKYNMNGIYLNCMTAVFQLFFSLIFSIPAIYAQPGYGFSDLSSNIVNGYSCMIGINSILGDVIDSSGNVIIHKDNCSQAPFYYGVYLVLNIGYNVIGILMLKYGSANVLYLVMTVIVPLVDISFCLDFMPLNEPFTVYSVGGLVVIIVGLSIYRFSNFILRLCYRPASRKYVSAENNLGDVYNNGFNKENGSQSDEESSTAN